MKFSLLVPVALSLVVSAVPTRRAAFSQKNGDDAIALKYVAFIVSQHAVVDK
jgi:hypothetical protein